VTCGRSGPTWDPAASCNSVGTVPTSPSAARRPVVALRRLLSVPAVALLAAAPVLAACSGDDGAAAPVDGSAAADGGGHDHGGDSEFGSSMGARTVSVEEVAELGPGPSVGEAWSGLLGLNVCGRFLEPPTAVAGPVGGFATPADGTFTLTPTDPGDAGHGATVGDLARLVGIDLSTATISLPETVKPATLDLGATGPDDADLPLAGATLRTGDACTEDVQAEVQLWIYDREAVDTGDGVLQVVTDPEDVAVVEDGMAFVIALSPTSSLPTLPPSALIDQR
jgi:hypothetical protein